MHDIVCVCMHVVTFWCASMFMTMCVVMCMCVCAYMYAEVPLFLVFCVFSGEKAVNFAVHCDLQRFTAKYSKCEIQFISAVE